MLRTCILATSRLFHEPLMERLKNMEGYDFVLARVPEDLSIQRLEALNPKYIFFPHWSTVIPREVYENYECVMFHMTDLPFGRGGSPLQNLIVRGIQTTKISAFRCVKEMDAGPIYLKKDLSLDGRAQDIFKRASVIMGDMITNILKNQPVPLPQKGEVTLFKRRTPLESDITEMDNLQKVYDHIRMLDAEGYPTAFMRSKSLHIEFTNVSFKEGSLLAEAKISLEKKG